MHCASGFHLRDKRDHQRPQLSAGEGSEPMATRFARCRGRATGAPISRVWATPLQKRRFPVTIVASDYRD